MTVVRRMSWNIPLRKKPKFRKDLAAGTEGVIESWANHEMRTVLLKVNMTLEGNKVPVTQAVSTRVCVAAYMCPCVWMCTYVYMFCSPLHLTSFAPVAAWVLQWRRWGLTQLLDKDLFFLVFVLGLDKDLPLLPLGLLLQMLLEIVMLHGALVLQEVDHLEVHLQNLGQRLPMNLLRTGSPPWAG